MKTVTEYMDRYGCVEVEIDEDLFNDDDSEYLEHHGVVGQKWGVMHGPPYPLDEDAAKQAKRKAESAANDVKKTVEKVKKSIAKSVDSTKNILAEVHDENVQSWRRLKKETKDGLEEKRKKREKKKAEAEAYAKKVKEEKEKEEKEAYEAEKKRIINEGDLEAASKRASDFTNDEIREMVDRYSALKKVHDIGELDQADEFIRKARTDEERMQVIQKISTGDVEWAAKNPDKLTQSEMEDLMKKYGTMLNTRDFNEKYDAQQKNQRYDNYSKRSNSAASTASNILKFAGAGLGMYTLCAGVHNALNPDSPWPTLGGVAGNAVKEIATNASTDDFKKIADVVTKSGVKVDAATVEQIVKAMKKG